jgi:hypothetical protein
MVLAEVKGICSVKLGYPLNMPTLSSIDEDSADKGYVGGVSIETIGDAKCQHFMRSLSRMEG